MLRRSILVVMLILGMVVAVSTVTAGGQGEDGETLTIAYLPPTYDEADFYGQFAQGLWQGLDEAGIEYEQLVRSPASHEAHQQQLSIVEDVLAVGVDYIVLCPTSYEALQPAYQKINAAGVPLIIGNYSDPFPEEYNATALSFVGYQHADGGKALADYIAENYPEGTKMAIINGVPGYITEDRAAKEHHLENGMDIIAEEYANWDRAQAYDTAERLLQAHDDLEIIQANNSYMAMGTVEAVDSAGRLDEVDVYGAGGILEELDAIVEGRLAGTWYRDPLDMGQGAAEAIMLHMEGREDEVELSYNVPIRMITSYEEIVEYVNPASYTGEGREWPPARP